MSGLRWLGVVRHGESTGNVARAVAEDAGADVIDIAERDADVPLSPTGREQAAAVGRWLAGLSVARRPDVLVSSPYRRAVDTARIALDHAGLDSHRPPLRLDERLRDRELGVLDLLTFAGVSARHPEEAVRKQRLGKFYYRPPGGESWADVALRLRSLLGDVERAYPDGRVLLFGHEAPIFLLRYILESIPEADLLAVARATVLANGSITTWERDGGALRIARFNDTRHLDRQGAPATAESDDRARPA
jgi:broad specificity phosphatase PhoE